MEIRDYVPLNTELMANPVNWVIILLMVFIAGLALSLAFHNPQGSTGSN